MSGVFAEEEKDSSRRESGRGKFRRGYFWALGLQYVPPSLREVEKWKRSNEMNSELLEFSDLKGCSSYHCPMDKFIEMAEEADRRGWEYLGIADHSKASFQANGLDEGVC